MNSDSNKTTGTGINDVTLYKVTSFIPVPVVLLESLFNIIFEPVLVDSLVIEISTGVPEEGPTIEPSIVRLISLEDPLPTSIVKSDPVAQQDQI